MELVQFRPVKGKDPFADMRALLGGDTNPLVCDVSANLGQSIDRFRRRFPRAVIHSFEPSPKTFAKLGKKCDRMVSVSPWNYAVGSRAGRHKLIENTLPGMSSILPPGKTAYGEIDRTVEIDIVTLDQFAEQRDIDFIHILKSDAQGYELEVFKGAQRMMQRNKIALIYFEFIFSEMYDNLPAFDEVFRFLSDQGFQLVSFYQPFFQNDLVSWADVLFINSEYYREHIVTYSTRRAA